MRLFESPVQKILCATSLVFVRPARKNQVEVIIKEWIETPKELGRPIQEPKGRLVFA